MFHTIKSTHKMLAAILVSAPLLSFTTTALAAAPDGLGPWADEVVSYSQGLMKNGSPVLPERSDTTQSLGVAEMTEDLGTFYSLGFGGSLTLKFQNGISQGALIVETTWEDFEYPAETAKVEISTDGLVYQEIGNITKEDGEVTVPEGFGCAQFMRITDTSNPELYEPTADGFDVDGVQSTGDSCMPDVKVNFSTLDPSCTSDQVSASAHIQKDGINQSGVRVVFKYNGQEKIVYTGNDGRTSTSFTYNGDGHVEVQPDGFPSDFHSITKETNCESTPGQVLGATTQGQILGATTYAETGIAEDIMMSILGLTGATLFTTGSVLHIKNKA